MAYRPKARGTAVRLSLRSQHNVVQVMENKRSTSCTFSCAVSNLPFACRVTVVGFSTLGTAFEIGSFLRAMRTLFILTSAV